MAMRTRESPHRRVKTPQGDSENFYNCVKQKRKYRTLVIYALAAYGSNAEAAQNDAGRGPHDVDVQTLGNHPQRGEEIHRRLEHYLITAPNTSSGSCVTFG
jgi:hypothetical protein